MRLYRYSTPSGTDAGVLLGHRLIPIRELAAGLTPTEPGDLDDQPLVLREPQHVGPLLARGHDRFPTKARIRSHNHPGIGPHFTQTVHQPSQILLHSSGRVSPGGPQPNHHRVPPHYEKQRHLAVAVVSRVVETTFLTPV